MKQLILSVALMAAIVGTANAQDNAPATKDDMKAVSAKLDLVLEEVSSLKKRVKRLEEREEERWQPTRTAPQVQQTVIVQGGSGYVRGSYYGHAAPTRPCTCGCGGYFVWEPCGCGCRGRWLWIRGSRGW